MITSRSQTIVCCEMESGTIPDRHGNRRADRASDRRWLRAVPWMAPLLLMLLLGLTPGISFHEDLGRHLLLGRIIREQRTVPRVNLLSYTHPDHPFINHHWLGAVAIETVHRAVGLNGLIILKALLLTASLALALRAVQTRRISLRLWLLAIGAAVMLGFRSHIRPELATYLGIGILLLAFERIRRGHTRWWWVVALTLWIWSNTHIYFIFGLGMIGAFLLERWISAWLRDGPPDRYTTARLAAIGIGTIGLCALGPNGFSGLMYPLRIFDNYGVAITENASPLELWRRVVNPMLLVLPWFALGALAATITVLRRAWLPTGDGTTRRQRFAAVRWADLIILIAGLVATLTMARSAPLLALAAMPVAAAAWGGSPFRQAIGLTSGEIWRGMAWAVTLLINLGVAWFVIEGGYARRFPSPLAPQAFGFDNESRYLTLRGLAHDGLRGPIFNDYNIGSLVGYNLYPEPVYADNRPEAFPEYFWRGELTPALALDTEWEAVRRARDINTIIVSLNGVGEGYVQELVRRPEWILVHVDSLCIVFVLNHPRNSGFIERHAIDETARERLLRRVGADLLHLPNQPWWHRQVVADRILFDLYSLHCIGEGNRAWPLILQLHHLYPDFQQTHELMRVTAPATHYDLVDTIMARAARYPVAVKQVTDWAWRLRAKGDPKEAERVLQRGKWFFPAARIRMH